MATAWEPIQELFQGVIVCLHSDFRIGGLKPGESKKIHGKIYLMARRRECSAGPVSARFPRASATVAVSGRVGCPQTDRVGWDEPDTAFLKTHQAIMEQTPFDGCVFHVNASGTGKGAENFTWLCWGHRRFSDEELSGAFSDLRGLSWNRFRQNFLRFNVTPGDLDWFDDHQAVLANARLAARLAREGHCQGILFDTEQYERGLFSYAKQRDAKTRSWQDYAGQARRRGRRGDGCVPGRLSRADPVLDLRPELALEAEPGGSGRWLIAATDFWCLLRRDDRGSQG